MRSSVLALIVLLCTQATFSNGIELQHLNIVQAPPDIMRFQPNVPASVINPIPTSGAPPANALASMLGASASTGSTMASAASAATNVAGACLRNGKNCGSVLETTVANVINAETNNEIAFMAKMVDVRFSSYTGPMVAVAVASPKIVDNLQKGDYFGAVGTVVDAALKYKAGAIAFTTCTAYTSFLGPAAVVPGIACSVASTMAIDGTYEKVNNFISAPPVNTRSTKRARGSDEF